MLIVVLLTHCLTMRLFCFFFVHEINSSIVQWQHGAADQQNTMAQGNAMAQHMGGGTQRNSKS